MDYAALGKWDDYTKARDTMLDASHTGCGAVDGGARQRQAPGAARTSSATCSPSIDYPGRTEASSASRIRWCSAGRRCSARTDGRRTWPMADFDSILKESDPRRRAHSRTRPTERTRGLRRRRARGDDPQAAGRMTRRWPKTRSQADRRVRRCRRADRGGAYRRRAPRRLPAREHWRRRPSAVSRRLRRGQPTIAPAIAGRRNGAGAADAASKPTMPPRTEARRSRAAAEPERATSGDRAEDDPVDVPPRDDEPRPPDYRSPTHDEPAHGGIGAGSTRGSTALIGDGASRQSIIIRLQLPAQRARPARPARGGDHAVSALGLVAILVFALYPPRSAGAGRSPSQQPLPSDTGRDPATAVGSRSGRSIVALAPTVVFDGRDPTVFVGRRTTRSASRTMRPAASPAISSSTSAAGARVVIGPGLAERLAGQTIRMTLLARASPRTAPTAHALRLPERLAISHWQDADLSRELRRVGLIWRVPSQRTDRDRTTTCSSSREFPATGPASTSGRSGSTSSGAPEASRSVVAEIAAGAQVARRSGRRVASASPASASRRMSGVERRLIGRVDAGEVLDLAGARLLVEALRVARLGDRRAACRRRPRGTRPRSTSSRAMSRSERNGEMNDTSTIRPASTNSFAVSATRRMFSTRSASVKPRSRLRPWRTLSPSSR